MKFHVVFGILCVLVSLYAVILYKVSPVLHLIPGMNYDKMEQKLVFHEEVLLQPTEKAKTESRINISEEKLGIQTRTEMQETTNKVKISQRAETKGQQFTPRANLVILSPGRGGSSFLGSIFDSNPRMMYWFEPLRVVKEKLFNANLIREGNREEMINYRKTCINVIDSMFKCDFSNITNASLSKFSADNSRRKSKALTSEDLCPNGKCLPFSNALLSKSCNSYNHTVIKILTSRVPNNTLQSLQDLFQQDKYNAKIIHLVRDPRAVIYSRISSVKWIKRSFLDQGFRLNVHAVCDPIMQNIKMGLLYPPSWLKNRFKLIRYEDFAVNTTNVAQELYKFAGFDWSASVEEWISAHDRPPSNSRERSPYSLFRNASHVIEKWKNAPKELIQVVEDVCGDLMEMLGYEKWLTKA